MINFLYSYAIQALINRLLFRQELGKHINATSFVSPYFLYEARIPRIGWCSNDLVECSFKEGQFIEVDFGAEVIIEAVAVLRVGGSCVKQYYVKYAGADEEFHCAADKSSNSTVCCILLFTLHSLASHREECCHSIV